MKIAPVLILTVTLVCTQSVKAQYYNTGQDPSSISWMHVKTSHFDVIYPESFGTEGVGFAHRLDTSYSMLTRLFPERKFRIPVIIHNYSTQSNGYVAWAPKRMELYPAPEQDAIPYDPLQQLSRHELTHVMQLESIITGFTKGMSFILGQQAPGIVSSMLPLWFLEGNAVFSESFFSNSGRGRYPSFDKELRALTASGIMYSYDKSLNGSFRNFVPDYYQYGYEMNTFAIVKYGPLLWDKVLRFTGEQPFTLNPFSISLVRNSGLTKKRLYYETSDSLGKEWSKIIDDRPHYKELNPEKKGRFINYYSPIPVGKDSIIAIRTSLTETPVFVMIDTRTGREKVLYRSGYLYPWFISYAKGKIVWVEGRPDPRWQNRDFSVIRIFDTNRGLKTLTRGTRYLSASISPDGKLVCAAENTLENHNNLVFLDSRDARIIFSVPSPDNVYLQHPQWSADGKQVTVITLSGNNEGIVSFSIDSKRWLTLVGPDKNDLQSAAIRNDSLFFVSSYSGTDNVFLRDKTGKITRVTDSRFGVRDVVINEGQIIFSDYSAAGNSICTGSIQSKPGNPVKEKVSFLIDRVEKEIPRKKTEIKGDDYTPEPYRKWQHLFNFHSWMPFYADLAQIQSDPLNIRPGVTLLSQNPLSTLLLTAGYEYSADRRNVFHARATWYGWFPVIESQIDYGEKPLIYGKPPMTQAGMSFINTIYLPFNFTSGRFSQYLQLSLQAQYSRDIYRESPSRFDYSQLGIQGRLYFSNSSVTALRDIYPEWAQTIDLNYMDFPQDKQILGSRTFVKTGFFLPGFFRNNGIRIRIEKEKINQSLYILYNSIDFPRGYNNIISDDLNYVSADYFFPFAYPDFNVASIVYIKRLRASLFYDYARGTGNYHPDRTFNNFAENFSSFGTEVLVDFHFLRLPFLISGGVQSSWKKPGEMPVFNLIFNINLYGTAFGKKPKL